MHEEIHMGIKKAATRAYVTLGAITIAGALLAGGAAAKEYDVPVRIHVSTRGLDLSQPAGAHQLYERIQRAAYVACTYADRVDLKPADGDCYEQALGEAIRSAHVPLLTQIYLETHTYRVAAAHGIELPEQVAAK
jgi:UrcA family protein